MIQWIWTLLQKLWNWGMHDGLARRVPGDESPLQVSGRPIAEWSKESGSKLDDGSNAQRLEEEERNQGSGTSELSVKSGGVLEVSQGSGDLDYSMKEHFFSPLNPTNK
jgi:hypothetical protein